MWWRWAPPAGCCGPSLSRTQKFTTKTALWICDPPRRKSNRRKPGWGKCCASCPRRYDLTPLRLALCAGLMLCAAGLSGGWAWRNRRDPGTVCGVFPAGPAGMDHAQPRPCQVVGCRLWGAAQCGADSGRLVRGVTTMRGGPDVNYIEWEGLKDLPSICRWRFCCGWPFCNCGGSCAPMPWPDRSANPGRRCLSAGLGRDFCVLGSLSAGLLAGRTDGGRRADRWKAP